MKREERTGGRADSTAIRENSSRTPRNSGTRIGGSGVGSSSTATRPPAPEAGGLQASGIIGLRTPRARNPQASGMRSQPLGTGTTDYRARDFATGRRRANVRMGIRWGTARQKDRVRDR